MEPTERDVIRRALRVYEAELHRVRVVEDRLLPQTAHYAIANEQEAIQVALNNLENAERAERIR
jgi:hypothetical protein